jgi:uncharacterized membrane protein YfcA
MTIAIYLLVGGAVGVLSGTLGIGGGVILVPALIWLFGFEQPKATGTTLAVLALPVGWLAAWRYYNRGFMDLEAALWIAPSFALGAYAGAVLVPLLPVSALRLAFGFMLLYIGLRFVVASDSEVTLAAATVVGLGLAWLSYLALRAVGRRLPRPALQAQSERVHAQGRGHDDYYI